MSSEIVAGTQAEENHSHERGSDSYDNTSPECPDQGREFHGICSEEPDDPCNKQDMEAPSKVPCYEELEARLGFFERRFEELQAKVNEGLSEHEGSLSQIHDEMSRMSGQEEFRQLRRDFDIFSKRLRRIVRAEDSLSAETLDAAKVPPDVLEITYAKTLNDLYASMLNIFGDRESSQIVEDTRDKVRQFSAGVDFFRFENGVFLVKGLSDAVSSKLVSIKQIHATYIELFKILSQAVPNYSSQDFRSFVETGSREYTVQKVVSHERSIERISSQLSGLAEELTNLTENMQFMAELQNNQLEDAKLYSKGIEGIQDQIKSIAKAVNLHTKALRKLGKDIEETRSQALTAPGAPMQAPLQDMALIAESLSLKANRDEMMLISEAIGSFREEVNETLANMQQQIQRSSEDAEKARLAHADILKVREDLEQLRSAPTDGTNRVQDCPPDTVQDAVEGIYADAFSPGHIEQVIIEELSGGPVTLKQLEGQIGSMCAPIGADELSAIVDRMEQSQLLVSFKKGRYTYFTLRELANV
ncbi:hypothetical protein [Methanolobus chelungpuianus]|uniref:Uncharacterized protein n=1 Tax=Methanolobus chelungpuianus TaxID=502115 RepID=A0AAE3HD32_9EURY|nr:hypothetical protein [Methanolobus chelungpuianus]MCQ6963358.1 hypothetical protein [Methanolobus chelungpuianus]